MPCYELVDYGEDAARSSPERVEIYAPTDSAAFSQAGTRAKKIRGPVDVARLWPKEIGEKVDWGDRYLTTVSPSDIHAKGFRMERLT